MAVTGDRGGIVAAPSATADNAEASPPVLTDSVRALMAQLGTSEKGLSSAEAEQRLQKFGPNEPTSTRHTAAAVQFLLLFTNPLVAILLFARAISAVVGELVSALVI